MKIKLALFTLLFGLLTAPVFASTSGGNMPIGQMLATTQTGMTFDVAPKVVVIGMVLAALVLCISRQWYLLNGFAAVIVAAFICMKTQEWMSYYGLAGSLF